jgi:hypothetical protein
VRELLPKEKTPLFHFTMYSEMLPQYQRNPAAFDLPNDVIIVWPDDNDGHMRALPADRGKWKHGVYYHLAYLGGKLTKQVTHMVAAATIAEQFRKIVNADATEYMLVNVSELRDYVMGARMIADITWDAARIYTSPHPEDRYLSWWTREYFGPAASQAESAYRQYFSLLETPERLWNASDQIDDLLDALYRKVGGESMPAPADNDLGFRGRQLQQALAAAMLAQSKMNASEQRFFSVDADLGLEIARAHTEAALRLEEALRATNRARMWQLVRDARDSLEVMETALRRAEYPPFDRWYSESWIRLRLSPFNPHRPYIQVRAFLASEGHGHVERAQPVTGPR